MLKSFRETFGNVICMDVDLMKLECREFGTNYDIYALIHMDSFIYEKIPFYPNLKEGSSSIFTFQLNDIIIIKSWNKGIRFPTAAGYWVITADVLLKELVAEFEGNTNNLVKTEYLSPALLTFLKRYHKLPPNCTYIDSFKKSLEFKYLPAQYDSFALKLNQEMATLQEIPDMITFLNTECHLECAYTQKEEAKDPTEGSSKKSKSSKQKNEPKYNLLNPAPKGLQPEKPKPKIKTIKRKEDVPAAAEKRIALQKSYNAFPLGEYYTCIVSGCGKPCKHDKEFCDTHLIMFQNPDHPIQFDVSEFNATATPEQIALAKEHLAQIKEDLAQAEIIKEEEQLEKDQKKGLGSFLGKD